MAWPTLRYMDKNFEIPKGSDDLKVKIIPVDTIPQRVEYVRITRKMTKAGFAKSIGLSPQGYQAMSRNANMQETTAIAIEYVHGFNREWLRTGSGSPKTDIWENIRGELEEEILRDMRLHFDRRLRSVKPLISGKDKDGKYYREAKR